MFFLLALGFIFIQENRNYLAGFLPTIREIILCWLISGCKINRQAIDVNMSDQQKNLSPGSIILLAAAGLKKMNFSRTQSITRSLSEITIVLLNC